MKISFSFFLALCTSALLAQVPNSFNYQSIVRDGFGALVGSQQLGVKVSIVKDSLGGNVQYSETHSPTTNSNGLFSIQIGEGNATTGVFDSIGWGSGGLYYQVEVDIQGGTNYALNSFHSFTSVPYSKYSEYSKSSMESEISAYSDSSSYANNGVPAGGNASQVLTKASNTDYDVTWVDGTGGAGVRKYLLRLEYTTSNHLVNSTTDNRFITATGFETSGASVDNVSVNTGNSVYSITVSFSGESNPPQGILVYAWDPVNYDYQVHPYRVDSSDLTIDTDSGDFTSSSNQFTPNMFGSFGSTSMTIDVRQDYIKYVNATGLGAGRRFAHAYLVFTFN